MSIVLKNVSYVYAPDTPDRFVALDDINMEIPKGRFIGLVGHTGSGKSTLIQLFNGLLQPITGTVTVDGVTVSEKSPASKKMRQQVGLVFQYPEYQLFEETVAKDIAFAPKNQGLDEAAREERVREAMALVEMDYERWKDQSPFDLSGGQKRRVAIAGVLAMKPDYLILDEPTAGLDPLGRDRILSSIAKLQKETGITVVLVSHNMDDVARFADSIVVMNGGRVMTQGAPRDVFQQVEKLQAIGLGVPHVTDLMFRLQKAGVAVPSDIYQLDEAVAAIDAWLTQQKGGQGDAF